MKKCLVIGDPHIQVQRLDDAREFFDKIKTIYKNHQHDSIVILGDLFHTFAVIRSEVLDLWHEFFSWCPNETTFVLVGNHDYAGQSGGSHALKVFNGKANIVQHMVGDGIWFAPFYRDHARFEEDCRKIPPGSVLVCHQSFQGAQFENGFYDPEGVSLDCVSHLKVISGHIHKSQKVGPVWYPGTPFQHSFGEAGQAKRVYSVSFSDGGYSVLNEYDLQMPEFVVIEAPSPGQLLDMLPSVNPKNQYKLVSRGTPAEIAAFWKDDRAKQFRSGARRVVDGMIPDRGEISFEVSGDSRKDRLANFIRDKKWRTDPEQLIADAAQFF